MRSALPWQPVTIVIGIQSVVRSSIEESLVQILSPKRRIDVLHDALTAKEQGRPFVVTFCGVNGVGKSTNLAKVISVIGIHTYVPDLALKYGVYIVGFVDMFLVT